jgi:FAD/FMN-containing dehydrogenase
MVNLEALLNTLSTRRDKWICSRSENPELFRLAIGGYGLFGEVTRVRLRLRRRTKLERVVRIIDIDDLMPAFADRIGEGYIYGELAAGPSGISRSKESSEDAKGSQAG